MNPSITASIVTYNSDMTKLLRAANSFLSSPLSQELVLVDNASDNLDISYLQNNLDAKVIVSSENRGFGAGHNLAIQHTNMCDYHLILNPDIEIQAGELEKMVAYMEQQPTVGLLSPKIVGPNGEIQLFYKYPPSILDLILRRLPKNYREHVPLVKQRVQWFEGTNWDSEQTYELSIAHGSFLFFRRSVFEQIQGFDEQFFLYFEDVDISLRVRELSKIMYFPKSEVLHHWERGSKKDSKLFWELCRSAYLFYKKWGVKWL